jgi:hypothetical protein
MVKLNLPFYGIELRTSTPIGMNRKRSVEVYHKGLKLRMFEFYIDERDNTIDIKTNTELSKKVESKFNEFKYSNVNYGNVGSGNEYEYSGSENLTVKDFFEYLKIENRNLIINKLTNK